MPVTPQITLTANLQTILAGANTAGFLRITLCGSGPAIPAVPGTCLLADATIPKIIGPQVGGTPISIKLYGNDVIVPGPDVTFYEIAVLDADKNVIQAGIYRFNGAGAVDLSTAQQILPPYGYSLSLLTVQQCAGAVPGNVYTSPGSLVLAVFYNGALIFLGAAFPVLGFTLAGTVITLNFNTEAGDRIDALCVS